MQKDYYKTLELPPHATLEEIRKAYRRLALTYHPDRNPGPYTASQFREIKEAYDVLTNPVKKDLYLQERWFNQSLGKRKAADPVTPVSILRLSLELEKYVSTLDAHRLNKEGLLHYVRDMLSDETIEKLRSFDERDVNVQIVITLLDAMKPLPFRFLVAGAERLRRLAGEDEGAHRRVNETIRAAKKRFLWDRYKIVVMFLFAILVCLLIYYTSR